MKLLYFISLLAFVVFIILTFSFPLVPFYLFGLLSFALIFFLILIDD